MLATLDVQYAWDNDREFFGIEVGNFDISFDDTGSLQTQNTTIYFQQINNSNHLLVVAIILRLLIFVMKYLIVQKHHRYKSKEHEGSLR